MAKRQKKQEVAAEKENVLRMDFPIPTAIYLAIGLAARTGITGILSQHHADGELMLDAARRYANKPSAKNEADMRAAEKKLAATIALYDASMASARAILGVKNVATEDNASLRRCSLGEVARQARLVKGRMKAAKAISKGMTIERLCQVIAEAEEEERKWQEKILSAHKNPGKGGK